MLTGAVNIRKALGAAGASNARATWGGVHVTPASSTEPAEATGAGPGSSDTVDDERLAAAYLLLIDQPGLDLEEFAARLGCHEESVRDIFDRLIDLALLYQTSEECELVPVSPIAAMHQLISREQTILRQRQTFLERSADTFSSILSKYGGNPDATGSATLAEHLPDLSAVRRRLQELAMSAQESVLAFSPTAASPAASRIASRPLDLGALRRGVRMRTLCLDAIAVDPEAMDYAHELAAAGAEIRLVSHLPMRMIIIDGTAAVVPQNPRHAADGAYVFRHESIVLALHALFESYWDQGLPLLSDESPRDCNHFELAVVRLLASGAKDDAVARQLGTSVRTVRRIIADLMNRAEVSSRFALGVYAAKHYWTEPRPATVVNREPARDPGIPHCPRPADRP
jgi:DNA-binding NarL/FixJ family response regulator/AraC-like DNA-binding protein